MTQFGLSNSKSSISPRHRWLPRIVGGGALVVGILLVSQLAWQRLWIVHLDTRGIALAGSAGDHRLHEELKDQVRAVSVDRVSDDSRPAVARALSGHLAAVVDDGKSILNDDFQWKRNLFEIAVLNRDGTVNQDRSGQIAQAVDAWVAMTLEVSSNWKSDGTPYARIMEHIGVVYGLAFEPRARSLVLLHPNMDRELAMAKVQAGQEAALRGITLALMQNPNLLPPELRSQLIPGRPIESSSGPGQYAKLTMEALDDNAKLYNMPIEQENLVDSMRGLRAGFDSSLWHSDLRKSE